MISQHEVSRTAAVCKRLQTRSTSPPSTCSGEGKIFGRGFYFLEKGGVGKYRSFSLASSASLSISSSAGEIASAPRHLSQKRCHMTKQNPQAIASSPRKRAYSVREAAQELSLSKSKIYDLLALGRLRAKKAGTLPGQLGGRLLVLGDSIDTYLASLPDAVVSMSPALRRREEAGIAQPR